MQIVERVPIDNDSLIGQAVSWFINKQAPDKVVFNYYENGYEIKVYADEDDAKEAADFWEKNVNPHLGGDD